MVYNLSPLTKNKQYISMKITSLKKAQAGIITHPILVCLVVIGVAYGGFQLVANHASAASAAGIESGISGYCLDVHNDSNKPNAVVDSWRCNDTTAQNWKVSGTTISHGSTDCLSVLNDATADGSAIVSSTCSQAPGQVWLPDKGGLLNPNSGLCLAVPQSETGQQLVLASCADLSQASETWVYKAHDPSTDLTSSCNALTNEGDKVACVAEKEWSSWQSGSPNHTELLNDYTNGYGYEEWCADFVSYVYKEAGFPFTGGESDGWDENIASNIQNMGFTEYPAGSYTPKAGDVAFFDYPGGHVEIVVSGGKTPTFIYGDSGTIDPTTGNGEMVTNTITSDSNGQVMYYLSPN